MIPWVDGKYVTAVGKCAVKLHHRKRERSEGGSWPGEMNFVEKEARHGNSVLTLLLFPLKCLGQRPSTFPEERVWNFRL